MVDALRELRLEMVGLARLVLGLTDESDAAAVASAEAQLEPILRSRKPRGATELAAGGAEVGGGEVGELEPIAQPLPSAPVIAAG